MNPLETAEAALLPRLRPGNGVMPDPRVRQTASGSDVIHFRHHFRGVPLFLAASAVEIDGERITVTGDVDSVQIEDLDVDPAVPAKAALRLATEHLQEKKLLPASLRARFAEVATFALSRRSAVFSRGPYAEPVTVELTIHDGRLGWLVSIRTRSYDEHLIVVAADGSDEILFSRDITARACTAPIFMFNPGLSPRETVPLPCDLTVYPAVFHENAGIVPFRWMDPADKTIGENVEMLSESKKIVLRAQKQGQNLVFNPSETSVEQRVLNAFYFCNFMHDFFGLLGFSDADGAFHMTRTTPGGNTNDRLILRLANDFDSGLGRMRGRNDGEKPELVLFSGSQGHTALDAAVVIHEYTHGVTQRMVGGLYNPFGVVLRQPAALGEAWSDFFAITIQNYYRTARGLAEEYVFANWCTGGTVRTASYLNHPGTYAQAGKGIFTEPHHAGEIWAAAAIDFARAVVNARGRVDGYPIVWRAMFQSFRAPISNPTFIAARNALFNAIVDPEILQLAKRAFAAHGMGTGATGPDPDSFNGNTASNTV